MEYLNNHTQRIICLNINLRIEIYQKKFAKIGNIKVKMRLDI